MSKTVESALTPHSADESLSPSPSPRREDEGDSRSSHPTGKVESPSSSFTDPWRARRESEAERQLSEWTGVVLL